MFTIVAVPPDFASKRRTGHTLVELVVSTFLVGMLLVTALRTVASSIRAGMSTADAAIGFWLAEGLMAEILTAEYGEPVDPLSLGRKSSLGAALDLSYQATFLNDPPGGFEVRPIPMKIRAGSWKRVVD